MRTHWISALALTLCAAGAQAATFNVSTPAQLQSALAAARAGDEIVLAAGTTLQYTNGAIGSAYFAAPADGTASAPITLRSASVSNPATLRGNDISSKILLYVTGDYWVIKDIKLSNGQKGLVFDNSNHSKAINVEVFNTGLEAIHVRDGSDYTLIENCSIYSIGLTNPQFGEGIYIGSDRSVWTSYDPYVDNTTVRGCSIGPDVGAEAFDVKEGSSNTLIEDNDIYGKGISAAAFEDSFIDLKGIRAYVRYNRFHQGNEPKIKRAIAVLDRDRDKSGYENVIHDNIFNMDDANVPLVEAYSGTRDIHAYDNVRNPAGEMYTSRVLQTRPSWYSIGGGTPPPPSNQAPSVSIDSVSGQISGAFRAGSPITVNATATDADGSVASVKFYAGTTLLGTDTSRPFSAVWSNPAAGSYSLTAVATDNLGASRTSSAVAITVVSAGTPPPPPPSSGLAVQYQRGDSNATDNRIRAHLKIANRGSSAVALSSLKARYWFTLEGGGSPQLAVDYAQVGAANVSSRFVNVGGNAWYAELSFSAGAGALNAGADTGPIKIRITASNNANQTEANDYSFGSAVTSYQDYTKITLYGATGRVWGVEP